MPIFQRVPRLLRWIFSVVMAWLAVMTLFRFLFYFAYNPPGKAFSGSAFIMGLRFDARIACAVGLFILLLCAIPSLNPFKRTGARKFWNILLPVLFMLMAIFYGTDYFHYDYLHQRLNASILNYFQDAGISGKMVWQSYPMVRIILALAVMAVLARFFLARLLNRHLRKDPAGKGRMSFLYVIAVLVLVQCIIGRIVIKPGQFPLRWSDAYTLSDDFKANLALNPFQSFFSTLSFRRSGYDIKKVRQDYPLMAAYLGVRQPDSNHLNYTREFAGSGNSRNRPNVIVVICESFSAYKSSVYGNPLNTTPYFNTLCSNGVFFDRCFTPSYGTARGVWATLTGIPDVEAPSTASRNPNAVDQHTIINDFGGYHKFYFLGGSATWANIRGLLTNNISGLDLYEAENFKASSIDVWGISDKNLFLESNKVLKNQTAPFFAVIQTADNHRPYTIPDEDRAAFRLVHYPEDSLRRFGFESNEEMNAFRYTDFCYQVFMEAARKENYFNNTIFVFVGDHGIRYSGTLERFPKSWTEQGLTCEHVPLLFYSPQRIQPKRIHDVCSQVDILPTLAALAGQSYRNTALGRDLLDTTGIPTSPVPLSREKFAFIIDHDVSTIGLVSNDYYCLRNLKTGRTEMVSVTGNEPVVKNPATDSARNYLSQLTDAFYETSKYLLLNNKKKAP
jgi:phosphoglycerol transferase MdoB-like AlkP superfamily enzyme